MSDPILSQAEQEQITDAAAHWCMRLHAEDCSAADIILFEQWLSAHPLHADEFRAMEEIWELSGKVSPVHEEPPAEPLPLGVAPSSRRPGRTYSWLHVAVAAAVTAAAVRIVSYIG